MPLLKVIDLPTIILDQIGARWRAGRDRHIDLGCHVTIDGQILRLLALGRTSGEFDALRLEVDPLFADFANLPPFRAPV